MTGEREASGGVRASEDVIEDLAPNVDDLEVCGGATPSKGLKSSSDTGNGLAQNVKG